MERMEIDVNENIIGAVIGPSGRSIVDIQQYSGARIQISKKGNELLCSVCSRSPDVSYTGTFSPGTRNRIVTISGNQESIGVAKYLIEQKIAEEESKRERHSQDRGHKPQQQQQHASY